MAFPLTNWTQLADATLDGDEGGRRALDAMCETYRRPVMVYLTARGLGQDEVEDVTQDFFLKLVGSRVWKRADPSKGRFRTFLLTILNHLVLHGVRDQHRQKRGGGVLPVSLDLLAEDGVEFAGDAVVVSDVFDREWALTLVADAVAGVEAEFAQRGQAREFALLRRFLPGAKQPLAYEDAALELGLSLTALKAAVHRLRQHFRAVLRAAVARTVSAPHEVDEELRYLGTLLIGARDHAQPSAHNGKDVMR